LKTRIAIGVGLAALGVVAATSAHAQTVPGNPPGAEAPPMAHPGLAPREVLRVVRASGLTPLTQPARRGQHYVMLASDNMGGQLRVVIGAFDGRIVHAAPARDPRFAYQPVRPRGYVPITPQYGAAPGTSRGMAPPPDLREPSAPLPRAAARAPVPRPPANTPQDPRLASAPDVTGSVPTRPTRTPCRVRGRRLRRTKGRLKPLRQRPQPPWPRRRQRPQHQRNHPRRVRRQRHRSQRRHSRRKWFRSLRSTEREKPR
jgi:hypothetical protein